jgi:hypothetical protein
MRINSRALFTLLISIALSPPFLSRADQVNVRYAGGLLHGFVALRTLEGTTIATGDVSQKAAGDRATSKLVLHFKDGSLHEETTEYTQREKFQLLKYRLVQKGPAFKLAMDTSIDVPSGEVTVKYSEEDGKEKVLTERMDLPADLANGMVPILLMNAQPTTAGTTFPMVACTPKPRLVKLAITPQGEETFSVGGSRRKAAHFSIKIEIGGVAGIVAPVIGKQPPDSQMWILGGEAPVFLRSEGPLFDGGPVWRIEQISPVWSRATPTAPSMK